MPARGQLGKNSNENVSLTLNPACQVPGQRRYFSSLDLTDVLMTKLKEPLTEALDQTRANMVNKNIIK